MAPTLLGLIVLRLTNTKTHRVVPGELNWHNCVAVKITAHRVKLIAAPCVISWYI